MKPLLKSVQHIAQRGSQANRIYMRFQKPKNAVVIDPDDAGGAARQSSPMCGYFQRGHCTLGSASKFAHPVLDGDTIAILASVTFMSPSPSSSHMTPYHHSRYYDTLAPPTTTPSPPLNNPEVNKHNCFYVLGGSGHITITPISTAPYYAADGRRPAKRTRRQRHDETK